MKSARWRQIEELYHRALELGEIRRPAFLRDACAGDRGLQEEVERLLAEEQQAGSFLEEPAFEGAARELAQDRPAADLPEDAAPTQLGPGAQLGPYRIEAPLGAGGMGEVFRAVDTRLGRKVAVKVSAQQFSGRFDREARAISALNHPHICTLYDVGPNYFVMEFVEGETLATKLEEGPLPMESVLRYGAQIADALAAAHVQGITHRDLKPANIMITKSGVKVLDFGLAKITRPTGGPKQSETLTASQAVMGTLGYMAPEQLEGKDCDARSDIFSMGLVLYEMATGRKAFTGDSQAALIAEVMRCQPAPMESVPEKFMHVVVRCLARDPDERWQTAKDVKAELLWAGKGEVGAPGVSTQEPPRRARAWWASGRAPRIWIALGVLVVLGSIATAWMMGRATALPGHEGGFRGTPTPSLPEMRLDITTPPTTDPVSLAISPDGQKVAFAATSDGVTQLWVRSLGSTLSRPLPGTGDATFPFWSPDSQSLGFFSDRQLKRIDIGSATVLTLAPAEGGRGGAWNRDGTILFQPTAGETPLLRISAAGGKPAAVTEQQARYPQFLPDGRHFLYYSKGTPEVRGIYVAQLDGTDTHRLVETECAGVYSQSGHLLFVRQGTLFAQALDVSRLTLTGNALPIAEQISVNGPLYIAPLSASEAGPIVYRAGPAGVLRQFIWFDRSGKEINKVGDPALSLLSPSMSPDGRYVALWRNTNGNPDVWFLDLVRGLLSRFTNESWAQGHPVWSPDGSSVAFSSYQKGPGDLYQRGVKGVGSEEPLFESDDEKTPTDWSHDGRFLLYNSQDPNSRDIWALPLEKGKKPFPVVRTGSHDENGQFSPDDKWIAYQSSESGRVEVYVQPFPGPGMRLQVSSSGGAYPRWRSDGGELFYLALDGRLMTVPIQFAPGAKSIEPGAAFALFVTRVPSVPQFNSTQEYVVSADGKRFLLDTLTEEAVAPITVILNWKPAAR